METQLAATVSAAQLDALRFAGKLPANAWRPSHSRRWLRWGVPLCLAGGALLVLCEVLAAERSVERSVAPLPVLEAADLPGEAAITAGPAAPATVAAAAAAPNQIDRQQDHLLIAIDALPLADAARQLAALTATELHGVQALPATLVIRRHWVGIEPAAAWRALLGDDASYALQCTARRCALHVAGAAPASMAAAPATASATASAEPDSLPSD